MADNNANVRLVKPDPAGIMATVFSGFASEVKPTDLNGTQQPLHEGTGSAHADLKVITRFSFLLLLAECGLSGIDGAGDEIWEKMTALDESLRSIDATMPYEFTGVTFRVFPTLISAVASAVFLAEERGGEERTGEDREKFARQNLMKKHIIPVYKRLKDGTLAPHIPALPVRLKPVPAAANVAAEPTPEPVVLPEAPVVIAPHPLSHTETPAKIPAILPESPAILPESPVLPMEEPVLAVETFAADALPRDMSQPANTATGSENTQHQRQQRQQRQQQQAPATVDTQTTQPQRSHSVQRVATDAGFLRSTSSSAHRSVRPVTRGSGIPTTLSTTTTAHHRGRTLASTASERDDARVGRSRSPSQVEEAWSEFLLRQSACASARDAKIKQLKQHIKMQEAGCVDGLHGQINLAEGEQPPRQPQLSAGTRRILAEMHVQPEETERSGRRGHLLSYLNTTQAASASASARTAHAPATIHDAAAGTAAAVAAGDALYQNAVNKALRRAQAEAESQEEVIRLVNSKKVNSRSEELLRLRLAREMAAACVYTAGQRQAAAAAGVRGSSAATIGVVPWWLFPLEPAETALVLYHTGFLAVELPEAAVEAAISRVVKARTGEAVVLESSGNQLLDQSDSLFGSAWQALTYHRTDDSVCNPIPSAVLLALLQAVVTGGYDVRLTTLEGAAAQIGLAHPFLTVEYDGTSGGAPTLTAAPKAYAVPVSCNLTDAMPPAFSAAINKHMLRLRQLATAHHLKEQDMANEGESLADEADIPCEALEVLEGRTVWPVLLLRPLKMLYTNRLAYLGRLTHADTVADVRSLAGDGPTIPVAQINRDTRRLVQGSSSSSQAANDLTFMPMLCRKSLEIAALRSDPKVPREILLLHRGAETQAKLQQKKAVLESRGLEDCTFRPNVKASRQTGGEPQDPFAGNISRFDLLYRQAQVKAQERAMKAAQLAAEREAAEAAECTFRPAVNVSPRARTAAVTISNHMMPPTAAFSDPLNEYTHETEVFAASLLPRVSDEVGSPGHTAARAQERSHRRSLLEEMTNAVSRGELPVTVDETGGKRRNSLVYLLSPSVPDPANRYRDPWTPGREPPARADVATTSSRAAPAAPKGYDAFLGRMKKSFAEKETKKKLDEALEGGYLHFVKAAILDPSSDREARVRKGSMPTQHREAKDAVDRVQEAQHEASHAPPPAANVYSSDVYVDYPLGPPPVVYVDVAVTPSINERIPLWAESNCQLVAAAFAQKHGLTTKMMHRLASTLEAQRAAAMSQGAQF